MLLLTSVVTACHTLNSTDPTPAQTNGSRVNIPYSEVIALPYFRYSAEVAYGEDPLQRIYVWQAADKTSASLVFIHGGCWLNAYDYTHGQAMFTALANAGVNVYTIEYRRTGDVGGGWPGSAEDVISATHQAINLAKSNNANTPVYLAGHSAGGHLALLAAQALSLPVRKVIGLAAITQPALYARGSNSCETATPLFFDGTPDERPDAYKEATPSIENIPPPVVLLQGTADQIVDERQSQLPGATVIVVPGAGHFDYLHSESLAYNTLLNILLNGQ